MNWKLACGVYVAVFGVLYQFELLSTMFTIAAHLFVSALGIYLGASLTLVRGKQYTPPPIPKELQHPHASIVLQNMMESRSNPSTGPRKVVISRNMDLALQEIIELVLRDFIKSWYKDLAVDQMTLLSHIQTDLWLVIEKLSEMLSKVDTVQFMTKDVAERLIVHFRDVRIASKKLNPDGPSKSFVLHSWLQTEEDELNFLRKISELLLLECLPKNYVKAKPIRHLFREVLANMVLKPSIDLLCDPDYINMTLISYIEYREKLSEDTRKTYTYAATYEEFVKMIEKCADLEHLVQLRLNIMTEIVQATTLDNLKQSNPEKSDGSKTGNKSTAKGELLKTRNLKKYTNQLKVAKTSCEKRISKLGSNDNKGYTYDYENTSKVSGLPGQKVLEFDAIMATQAGREYLALFLEREELKSLMGFWEAVEKLKDTDARQQHHVATDLYQRYVSSSSSAVKIDKSMAKRMESFMLGDRGPDAFYEAQEQVYNQIQLKHYPSFLVSDLYFRFVNSLEDSVGESDISPGQNELFFEPKEEGWSDDDDDDMFSAQAYHAKQKLQHLDSKIINKTQALEALRMSTRSDPKVQKAQDDIEQELELMKFEKRNLESHILRTQQWCENVGKWKAHVYEAEIQVEGEKKDPVFVLVIHLSGSSRSRNLQNSTEGWVINRRLHDFYNVHEKLVQIAGSWLKNKELPKIGRFTTVDEKFMKNAKGMLNDYLSVILKDERLAQSEALYKFFTPTPEYFPQPGQDKKTGFFLKNIFKRSRSFTSQPLIRFRLPSISQSRPDPEDELLFSTEDKIDDRSKDSIAEPLYGLIKEIYDLHGMFKWLRKSFITVVEVTFGRSINRQLRETVYWLFSEPMIIYYLRNFKDSMWPNGELADPLPERSVEDKQRTRMKAKEKFLLIQPDAVKSLVGEENARRGTIKMFEVLQDVKLNKHLFYVMLQLLLNHMIPDLAAFLEKENANDESDHPVVIGSPDS